MTLILCFLFLVQQGFSQTGPQDGKNPLVLSMMTYNLKFASPTFEPAWDVRKEWQVDLIREYKPDVLGTQEGLKEQIDYLAKQLPEYVVVGEGRKGGDDDEHMAIFFRRDKFRLRELSSFQLSETPHIIGSGPEVNPRMVTWTRLALINQPPEGEKGPYPEDYRGHWENTREFYVFNTHYFNSREEGLARLNASKLILEKINELDRFGEWQEPRPVILMGDFNCRPGSPPYEVLVAGEGSLGPHEDKLFDTSKDHNDIDWILYKGDLRVLKYEEVDFNVEGIYPSDHKPIYVEFEIHEN